MDKHPELAIFADTINHRREICLDSIESISDRTQMPFKSIHTRPQTLPIVTRWLGQLWWPASAQNCVEVLRRPTQRSRKCLQSPCAATGKHSAVLMLAG